jgi:hypothetical protein
MIWKKSSKIWKVGGTKLREESPNIPHQIWRRIEQTMTAEKEKENFELELLHDNLSPTSPAK